MKDVLAEVSIFYLWTNWIHLVTCSKIKFRDLHCCSRYALDKIFEIYTFDRCPQGWSGQKSFLACGDTKKRIGEQLNYFWDMCPKPFSWAKNKRELFFRREVERTAAIVVYKTAKLSKRFWQILRINTLYTFEWFHQALSIFLNI